MRHEHAQQDAIVARTANEDVQALLPLDPTRTHDGLPRPIAPIDKVLAMTRARSFGREAHTEDRRLGPAAAA
jgi:hypothetical protein